MVGEIRDFTTGVGQGAHAAATKVKRTAVAALIVKDIILALLVGGIGLLFFGLYMLFARWMDPAAAAFLVGGGALASLAVAAGLGVRRFLA